MLVEALFCLALNIYHEARNQTDEGQIAVAHVVFNRMRDRRFPDTACEVITQGGEDRLHKCQFSWYCDGKSDKPTDKAAWDRARQNAIIAIRMLRSGYDPTNGALWYHAEYVQPYWSVSYDVAMVEGTHIFYHEKK